MGSQLKVSPDINGHIRYKADAEGIMVRLDLNSMGAADGDVWNLRGRDANDVEVFNLTIFATEMLPGILVSGLLRVHPAYQGKGWGKLLAEWRDAVAEANGLRVMCCVKEGSGRISRLIRQRFVIHASTGDRPGGEHQLMLRRFRDDTM